MNDKAQQGTVVSIKSKFFIVDLFGRRITCVGRGSLKEKGNQLLVGDRVLVKTISDDEGVITEILPRENSLIRPPVANVDQAVIVVAFKNPDPNWGMVDRMLLLSEANDIRPVLCFNKSDLASARQIESAVLPYRRTGYQTLITSAAAGTGIAALQSALAGKTSVFAGASGTGKSSLLNRLCSLLTLKTGIIAEKTGRGRHTTTHVELFELPGQSLVADTPGFTRLHLPEGLSEYDLGSYFPEIQEHAPGCRFNDCVHEAEPGCAVKEAVESGLISLTRYDTYLSLLSEIRRMNKY